MPFDPKSSSPVWRVLLKGFHFTIFRIIQRKKVTKFTKVQINNFMMKLPIFLKPKSKGKHGCYRSNWSCFNNDSIYDTLWYSTRSLLMNSSKYYSSTADAIYIETNSTINICVLCISICRLWLFSLITHTFWNHCMNSWWQNYNFIYAKPNQIERITKVRFIFMQIVLVYWAFIQQKVQYTIYKSGHVYASLVHW